MGQQNIPEIANVQYLNGPNSQTDMPSDFAINSLKGAFKGVEEIGNIFKNVEEQKKTDFVRNYEVGLNQLNTRFSIDASSKFGNDANGLAEKYEKSVQEYYNSIGDLPTRELQTAIDKITENTIQTGVRQYSAYELQQSVNSREDGFKLYLTSLKNSVFANSNQDNYLKSLSDLEANIASLPRSAEDKMLLYSASLNDLSQTSLKGAILKDPYDAINRFYNNEWKFEGDSLVTATYFVKAEEKRLKALEEAAQRERKLFSNALVSQTQDKLVEYLKRAEEQGDPIPMELIEQYQVVSPGKVPKVVDDYLKNSEKLGYKSENFEDSFHKELGYKYSPAMEKILMVNEIALMKYKDNVNLFAGSFEQGNEYVNSLKSDPYRQSIAMATHDNYISKVLNDPAEMLANDANKMALENNINYVEALYQTQKSKGLTDSQIRIVPKKTALEVFKAIDDENLSGFEKFDQMDRFVKQYGKHGEQVLNEVFGNSAYSTIYRVAKNDKLLASKYLDAVKIDIKKYNLTTKDIKDTRKDVLRLSDSGSNILSVYRAYDDIYGTAKSVPLVDLITNYSIKNNVSADVALNELDETYGRKLYVDDDIIFSSSQSNRFNYAHQMKEIIKDDVLENPAISSDAKKTIKLGSKLIVNDGGAYFVNNAGVVFAYYTPEQYDLARTDYKEKYKKVSKKKLQEFGSRYLGTVGSLRTAAGNMTQDQLAKKLLKEKEKYVKRSSETELELQLESDAVEPVKISE